MVDSHASDECCASKQNRIHVCLPNSQSCSYAERIWLFTSGPRKGLPPLLARPPARSSEPRPIAQLTIENNFYERTDNTFTWPEAFSSKEKNSNVPSLEATQVACWLPGHISVVLHTQIRHSLHLDTIVFSLGEQSSGFSYNRSTWLWPVAGCTRGDQRTELWKIPPAKVSLWCPCQQGQFS